MVLNEPNLIFYFGVAVLVGTNNSINVSGSCQLTSANSERPCRNAVKEGENSW